MNLSIQTTEDGSNTLYVDDIDEHYHSMHGAIEESKYVYIQHGLHACKKQNPIIVEIGFGTGLNALLTAIECTINNSNIIYYSFEKYPISDSLISCLNYNTLIPKEFSSIFNTIHEIPWNTKTQITDYFTLEKIQDDIILLPTIPQCDIVFFDAFAPNKQAEMWTEEIFTNIYKSMNPNGILVTYCAKGDVRRTLKKIGFKVNRLPGPPGKWEMIQAEKI